MLDLFPRCLFFEASPLLRLSSSVRIRSANYHLQETYIHAANFGFLLLKLMDLQSQLPFLLIAADASPKSKFCNKRQRLERLCSIQSTLSDPLCSYSLSSPSVGFQTNQPRPSIFISFSRSMCVPSRVAKPCHLCISHTYILSIDIYIYIYVYISIYTYNRNIYIYIYLRREGT